MVNAYSILARNGRDVTPTLIDYVQDRNGKVRFRADTRPCERCNMPEWDGKPMPRPPARTKQVMDPRSRLSGRPHARRRDPARHGDALRKLKRPIFGKTGTTTGPTNVWFVGGSADIDSGRLSGL